MPSLSTAAATSSSGDGMGGSYRGRSRLQHRAPAGIDKPDHFHYQKTKQRFPSETADEVANRVHCDGKAHGIFGRVKDRRMAGCPCVAERENFNGHVWH